MPNEPMGVVTMSSSKEVVVLIILIFVVLVSTVKAKDIALTLVPDSKVDTSSLLQFEPKQESKVVVREGDGLKVDPQVELGVASTSSTSNVPDDYGLVVTIKKSF